MSLLATAANLFMQQLGGQAQNLDNSSVQTALQKLLPVQAGDLDLAALAQRFLGEGAGGGLLAAAAGMLGGSGGNINVSRVIEVLGQGNVGQFAQALGLNTDTAASGLAGAIPALLANLKEGGVADLAGSAAKSVLGKLF